MKMNKKGFTLIEMLVVIAIIAVLVSIIVPTVSNSTEKAREAADAANIRSMVSEISIKGMTTAPTADITETYTMTQTGEFINTDIKSICEKPIADFASAKTVTITYVVATGEVTLTPKT